jgi:hypothetical protein
VLSTNLLTAAFNARGSLGISLRCDAETDLLLLLLQLQQAGLLGHGQYHIVNMAAWAIFACH